MKLFFNGKNYEITNDNNILTFNDKITSYYDHYQGMEIFNEVNKLCTFIQKTHNSGVFNVYNDYYRASHGLTKVYKFINRIPKLLVKLENIGPEEEEEQKNRMIGIGTQEFEELDEVDLEEKEVNEIINRINDEGRRIECVFQNNYYYAVQNNKYMMKKYKHLNYEFTGSFYDNGKNIISGKLSIPPNIHKCSLYLFYCYSRANNANDEKTIMDYIKKKKIDFSKYNPYEKEKGVDDGIELFNKMRASKRPGDFPINSKYKKILNEREMEFEIIVESDGTIRELLDKMVFKLTPFYLKKGADYKKKYLQLKAYNK